MIKRNEAQQKAAITGIPEDWRMYRGLRKRCVSAQRMDRKVGEKKKLSSMENTPAELCKSVKGKVGWNSAGPPTRLFEKGRYINSPSGMAAALNKFFVNKVKKLRSSIPHVETDPLARLRESMKKRRVHF